MERIFVFGDTHNCSAKDLYLAARAAKYYGCKTIIHTGDLADQQWGHPAFRHFQIYVFVTSQNENVPKELPKNWHLLEAEVNCILGIAGIRIYVNHYLGLRVLKVKDTEILEHSNEAAIYKVNSEIRDQYGYVSYVLFGHSHHLFCHCDGGTIMINPGEWEKNKQFVIINIRKNHGADFRPISLTVNQILVDEVRGKCPFWIRNLLCGE